MWVLGESAVRMIRGGWSTKVACNHKVEKCDRCITVKSASHGKIASYHSLLALVL